MNCTRKCIRTSSAFHDCWRALPDDLVREVLARCDIDTRRAMGIYGRLRVDPGLRAELDVIVQRRSRQYPRCCVMMNAGQAVVPIWQQDEVPHKRNDPNAWPSQWFGILRDFRASIHHGKMKVSVMMCTVGSVRPVSPGVML